MIYAVTSCIQAVCGNSPDVCSATGHVGPTCGGTEARCEASRDTSEKSESRCVSWLRLERSEPRKRGDLGMVVVQEQEGDWVLRGSYRRPFTHVAFDSKQEKRPCRRIDNPCRSCDRVCEIIIMI